MSLRQKIMALLTDSAKPMKMSEIYTHFPEIKNTTVRGRVYDSLGKGIVRLDRSLYVSAEAIVEEGNSLEVIDRMVNEGDLFDCIFLDIPYEAAGTKGGNRDLFTLDTISPEQFAVFLSKLKLLLRTDKSPILFMFTSGKTSRSSYKKYKTCFEKTGLKQASYSGTYMKLWPNGNRMNMGKYLMPLEWIHVFSLSGAIDSIENWQLGFALAPDNIYPTSKPYQMIKTLISQATKVGEWVFDPFGGSGKVLRACKELKRLCHIIDSNSQSFNRHLLPILSRT